MLPSSLNEAGDYVAPPASGGNLKSDGTVPMDATYTPTVNQGIATKKYVDDNTSDVDSVNGETGAVKLLIYRKSQM